MQRMFFFHFFITAYRLVGLLVIIYLESSILLQNNNFKFQDWPCTMSLVTSGKNSHDGKHGCPAPPWLPYVWSAQSPLRRCPDRRRFPVQHWLQQFFILLLWLAHRQRVDTRGVGVADRHANHKAAWSVSAPTKSCCPWTTWAWKLGCSEKIFCARINRIGLQKMTYTQTW